MHTITSFTHRLIFFFSLWSNLQNRSGLIATRQGAKNNLILFFFSPFFFSPSYSVIAFSTASFIRSCTAGKVFATLHFSFSRFFSLFLSLYLIHSQRGFRHSYIFTERYRHLAFAIFIRIQRQRTTNFYWAPSAQRSELWLQVTR